MLCYRCGSHVPDSAERCDACGQRQVGTARMPSTTGIRRRLSPALLAGAPYRTGDRMADRYAVKDAIGLGPLGYVFRATDEQQGIDVAVKMIHPRFVQTGEEREAFSRAVEPARRFLQPSLARVHDLGVDQGWPYLTYSFLDGLTLRRMIDSRLAKGQTFTLDEVEPFLGQLAAALEAAHPIGAHADLKPENVVILPDMLRIVDWGVARGLPRVPFVQAQRQKSTHRYLAPEVVAGADPDPRADLYALGVLVGEMLTGLTPDEDIPELRLTAPELPEAVEGFYRRALNERPASRFRSVRELYEEFVSLLAPVQTPAAPRSVESAAPAVAETPAHAGERVPGSSPVAGSEAPLDWAMEAAVVEVPAVDPVVGERMIAETPGAEMAAEPSVAGSSAAEPTPADAAAAAEPVPPEHAVTPEPIPAAALPRLDGHGVEAPRHNTREVVALEPPAWSGLPSAPAPAPGSERWRALRLWDADETVPEAPVEVPLPETGGASAEATGPELPLGAGPALGVPGSAPPRNGAPGLEHSDEEADRAVAGLTEMESGGDEPLLAEALGVDLLVDGDEPVPPRTEAPAPEPVRELPHALPPPAPPAREVLRPAAVTAAPAALPPVAPAVPRLVPDSRPWAPEPRPPPFRREAAAEPARTPEAPVLRPAALGDSPAVAVRAALPPPPTIPPLLTGVPRLAAVPPAPSAPAGGAAPTPLSVVPEPSPTRQEKVVLPTPPLEAVAAAPGPVPAVPARSAGSWSPAELLAQVISEIQAEERGAGLPKGPAWEPVPLDATQPISTDEVAARMAAAELRGTATPSVAAREDAEDLPALRHEAGRAGMRMALLTAIGLTVGILGAWTLQKVLAKPPRPQVERIAEPRHD